MPYDYSRSFVPTNRNTRPGTPSGTAIADSIGMQLTIIGGFTDGFHFHPVLVRGDSAVIYLHNNVLEYGREYSVTIDDGAIVCGDFDGIAPGEWNFSTRESGPADPRRLTVSSDGNADFSTVQGALDAVPDFCPEPTLITVAPGDYEEIVYARNKTGVTIRGAGMDRTHVHYANNEVFNPHPLNVKTNEWPGTFPSRRAAFALDNCSDIIIEDISIATDLRGQAEGLLLNGERIALYRVRITGSGDALQANGTIYMEDSELIGDGDTILGRGSLFAYRSRFYNHGGPFSWVRNVRPAHGDVFVECHFEGLPDSPADYGRSGTNHGRTYPDAEFVVIDCTIRHLIPEGWSSIGCESATMLEFRTRDADTGELVDVSMRHPYSRQLDAERDAELIANYRNPAFVLNGWTPASQLGTGAVQARGHELSGAMPEFYEELKATLTWPEAWGNSPEKDFGKWKERARGILGECMQTLPPAPGSFDMEIIGEEKREGYTALKIRFNVSAWSRIPAYLLVPDGEGPFPAVLMLHDHGAHFSIGKEKMVFPFGVADEVTRDALQWAEKCYDSQFTGDYFAQAGYVVLATDALFWGDRGRLEGDDYDSQQAMASNFMQMGASWAAFITADDARSADFLASLPCVDSKRIGCLGFSMGAYRSWMLAAYSERIAASASVCWMNTTQWLMTMDNNQNKGGSAYSMLIPGLRRYMDYPHVASISCPKPALFFNGSRDRLFPVEGVKDAYSEMNRVWKENGAKDRLVTRIWDEGHFFNKAMQKDCLEFFDKFL